MRRLIIYDQICMIILNEKTKIWTLQVATYCRDWATWLTRRAYNRSRKRGALKDQEKVQETNHKAQQYACFCKLRLFFQLQLCRHGAADIGRHCCSPGIAAH
jgi:hypothetical protein